MLQIESLSKAFVAKHALKTITFSVAEGTIAAVIGSNGAGKTTLFHILVGICTSDDGCCLFSSNRYSSSRKLTQLPSSEIGFLAESPFLYSSFTPRETLLYDITMRNIPEEGSNWEELAERFGITAFLHKKINTLSQGMKKRIALTCAFLGSPSLIVLDEPLNGLDIQTVIALKEQIKAEKQRGAVIMISSHVLSFLDDLADSFFFLKEGELIYSCHGSGQQAEEIYRQLYQV